VWLDPGAVHVCISSGGNVVSLTLRGCTCRPLGGGVVSPRRCTRSSLGADVVSRRSCTVHSNL
jgi:hypothetical protein